MTHQDIEGPWVLDTRELVRRPGMMHEVSRVVREHEAIGTDVIAIPAGEPVELAVRLESVVEGVLASGSVRGTAAGLCVRCLDQVDVVVDVRFQELFVYPERVSQHRETGDDEIEQDRQLDQDMLDTEELVRDAVVTALPFQPVCRRDCPGLCSECGARLAEDPQHHHDVIDPRWAALAELADVDHDDEKRN